MENTDVVKTLNELIQTSEDGRKGFAEAAEKAKDPSIKTELSQRSAVCGRAANELQGLVRTLGGEPETGGTVEGALHRGWVAVKSAFGDSDIAVLEEAERGEDHAKAVYTKALKADLPMAVRPVVDAQYQHVLRNHDRIRDLRDSLKRAA